ncbi:Cmr3 protein [Saccharomycopsis crataegensis]|uniref:Cmr3 protein n=1 Tax=Saccharomycopsis crataegensis TaxID=43959 RepID=A0AAV5QTK6_9ASCO|nr:Cmr3 protein [Saccharomycopsis crataegensis]
MSSEPSDPLIKQENHHEHLQTSNFSKKDVPVSPSSNPISTFHEDLHHQSSSIAPASYYNNNVDHHHHHHHHQVHLPPVSSSFHSQFPNYINQQQQQQQQQQHQHQHQHQQPSMTPGYNNPNAYPQMSHPASVPLNQTLTYFPSYPSQNHNYHHQHHNNQPSPTASPTNVSMPSTSWNSMKNDSDHQRQLPSHTDPYSSVDPMYDPDGYYNSAPTTANSAAPPPHYQDYQYSYPSATNQSTPSSLPFGAMSIDLATTNNNSTTNAPPPHHHHHHHHHNNPSPPPSAPPHSDDSAAPAPPASAPAASTTSSGGAPPFNSRALSYPDTTLPNKSPSSSSLPPVETKPKRHRRRNTDPHGLTSSSSSSSTSSPKLSTPSTATYSGMSPETAARNRCPKCNKQFKRPSSLQTHLYSHTGEKPFQCGWVGCERYFSVRSNMTRHMRLHERDIRLLNPRAPGENKHESSTTDPVSPRSLSKNLTWVNSASSNLSHRAPPPPAPSSSAAAVPSSSSSSSSHSAAEFAESSLHNHQPMSQFSNNGYHNPSHPMSMPMPGTIGPQSLASHHHDHDQHHSPSQGVPAPTVGMGLAMNINGMPSFGAYRMVSNANTNPYQYHSPSGPPTAAGGNINNSAADQN